MKPLTIFLLLSTTLLQVSTAKRRSLLQPFKKLVVFGDSVSDDGFNMMGDRHGFKHYCAGPNWAEYLEKTLDCKLENYAYSGALSEYGSYWQYDWSGGLWQVEKYLKEHNNLVEDGVLIGFQTMGINDFWFGLTDTTKIAENFYLTLRDANCKLAEAGAKHILALTIIDFGPVPGQRGDIEGSKAMREFVEASNRKIAEKGLLLTHKYPKTTLYQVDIQELFLHQQQNLIQEKFDHHHNDTQPMDRDDSYLASTKLYSLVHS